jgi:predicted amidohydrolase
VKVGFVQTRPRFGKKKQNVEAALAMMETKKADLFVLPELFNTGYSFRTRDELKGLAEPVRGGDTTGALAAFAKRRRTSIVAGLAERDGRKVYNSAVLVTPRGVASVYRKTHLFLLEKRLFDRGSGPYDVHAVGNARVGILICFDWIFPEPFRELALKGVDLIAHPANLILPYCQDAMVTRAIENRIFVVLSNRVGSERRRGEYVRFTGRSEIVSPKGRILLRAGPDEEAVRVIDVDLEESRNKRVTPLNDLFKDRRVELYEELVKARKKR